MSVSCSSIAVTSLAARYFLCFFGFSRHCSRLLHTLYTLDRTQFSRYGREDFAAVAACVPVQPRCPDLVKQGGCE